MTLPPHHIRFIKILPKNATGKIRCQTVIHPIYADIEYDALSYTWGNPPKSWLIELDGEDSLIRKNLWRFLHQISCVEDAYSNLIWIDAISINQANRDEKEHHIGQMGRIFEQARKVIVWLGPAHSGSDDGMTGVARYVECLPNRQKQITAGKGAANHAMRSFANFASWYLSKQSDIVQPSRH